MDTVNHLKITRTAEQLGVDIRNLDIAEVHARLRGELLAQWPGPATIRDREITFGFLGVDEPGRAYFLFTAEIDRRTQSEDAESSCGSVSPGSGVPCRGGHAPHVSDDGTLAWRDRAGGFDHSERCFTPPQGDALVIFMRGGPFMLDEVNVEQIKMWSGLNTLGLRLLLARLTDAAERVEAALLLGSGS